MSIIEDDKIILSRKEYDLARKSCKIASGSEGSVYKFSDKTVLKIYATKEEIEYSTYVLDKPISKIIDSYIPFLKIKNFSYIFPQKLVYIEEEFAGNCIEYIKGKDLGRKIFPEDLETLKKYIEKIQVDTNIISNSKIKTYDIYLTNVILNNGFRVIDIQPHTYSYDKNFTLQECKDNNDKALKQLLVYIVEATLVLEDIYSYFYGQNYRDKLLKKYRDGIELLNRKFKKGNLSVDEYINMLKIELSIFAKKEVKSLIEARKVLSKKKHL